MKTKVSDTLTFFIPYIAPEEYEKTEMIIATAKAFARSSNQKIFIMDYFRKEFLYVSRSLMRLYGEDESDIGTFNYETYIQRIPERERKMLQGIYEKSLELLYTFATDELKSYTLFYDIHFSYKGKKILINHKITPIALTSDRKIWIAMCNMAPSTNQEAGHALMLHKDKKDCYEYETQEHKWTHKRISPLKTMERDILILSAQGCTMTEMSARINKSIDAIKTCKRKMFKRLGVNTITEALVYAMNYRLL